MSLREVNQTCWVCDECGVMASDKLGHLPQDWAQLVWEESKHTLRLHYCGKCAKDVGPCPALQGHRRVYSFHDIAAGKGSLPQT